MVGGTSEARLPQLGFCLLAGTVAQKRSLNHMVEKRHLQLQIRQVDMGKVPFRLAARNRRWSQKARDKHAAGLQCITERAIEGDDLRVVGLVYTPSSSKTPNSD